jgi:hypothetical protein
LEGGINLFLYAEANPVNWIDPEGLWGLENHHIYPLYLGGDPKGWLSRIPTPYHRPITNEIRHAYPYGEKYPIHDPKFQKQVKGTLRDILKKYPLPKDSLIPPRPGATGPTYCPRGGARGGGAAGGILGILLALPTAYEAAKIAEQTGKDVWQIQLEMMGYSFGYVEGEI